MPQAVSPIARGPLVEWHRRNGATLETRDGWLIASRYPAAPQRGRTVLVDFAHRLTWELTGPGVGATLKALCGAEPAIRQVHLGGDWQACRLTAGRAILFGDPELPLAGALDVTGGWTSLALVGPDAEAILNKVTAVDVRERTLPVGGCCQGPIFGVNTLLTRFADRFELHICGDSAEFLWEVLLDAGAEFGVAPAGCEQVGTVEDRG